MVTCSGRRPCRTRSRTLSAAHHRHWAPLVRPEVAALSRALSGRRGTQTKRTSSTCMKHKWAVAAWLGTTCLLTSLPDLALAQQQVTFAYGQVVGGRDGCASVLQYDDTST